MKVRGWAWLTGIFLSLGLPVVGSGEDPAKPRVFVGSIDTTPESREALQQYLKEKGFKGCFVPEGAAPNTLLYRGPKQEYEAAIEAAWKFKPEGKTKKAKNALKVNPIPKRVVRDDEGMSDEEAMSKLGLSPLQKELTDALLQEAAKRSEEFKDQPPTQDLIDKGMELNRWKRKSLREILTRDQYSEWFKLYGAPAPQAELGPAPKLPKLDPAAKKTEGAILARLGLSVKQKKALDEHLAWRTEATEKMKSQDAGHLQEGQKISDKWRAGLDRILTKDQRKQYSEYWGPAPEKTMP
jgi:hypothetical protein